MAKSSKLEGNYLKRIFSIIKEDEDVKIESLIDLDEQIERFRQNKLDLINPIIIYEKGILFSKSLLYQNYSERYVTCIHKDQIIKLNLIDTHSYNQISDKVLK